MDDGSKATDLCEAAAKGDLPTVTRLVNEGVDVNSHVVGGVTALMKASANGHFNVIEFLVGKGANVNQTDRYGYDALLWAVDKHIAGLNTIKYLVEHHANVNAKTKSTGYTPLYWVAKHGDLDMVKYLVEKGAQINEKTKQGETPLHAAAANNHIHVLEYFINERRVQFDVFEAAEKGYTDAVRYFIDTKKKAPTSVDQSGRSILHRAAYGGSLDTVKYLIEEKNVNVNVANGGRVTPLHEASGKGRTSVATYLVDKGANVNAKDGNGRTPLYWAADDGFLEIVKLFVDVKDANVFQTDYYGNTLLHAAEWKGSLNVVKYLLEEKGLNVDARDDEGNTPLLETVRNGKFQVFNYLLEERKADFQLTDNEDRTCLHEAALRGYIDIVKSLVTRGADINAKERNGRTPVYYAADGTSESGGHLNVVRYFVDEKGADPHQRDNGGNTLLHAAEWNGALDVVKYLVEEKKLDINAKDNEGNTPLAEVIQRGKVQIAQYLKSKGARQNRRRRSAPELPALEAPVNSAYRHYSVINQVAHYTQNIASGCFISSVEPFTNAVNTIKFGSSMGSFSGLLMLLNVVYRKFFHVASVERTSLKSETFLSPPQLIERYIDPNATRAIEDFGSVLGMHFNDECR